MPVHFRGETTTLTVAQAIVEFLGRQWTVRDGVSRRLCGGVTGIFGHGNLGSMGEALQANHRAYWENPLGSTWPQRREELLQADGYLPYYVSRNEQASVHTAVGYARAHRRLSTLAVTSSIGPGATNLVTGAATATINRVPVLLLPGDTYATRPADPVLQQLEWAGGPDVTVNDCLRPVCTYFDRITRPEQLGPSLLEAMRVLTDPVQTGAVCLALPQDVACETYRWPGELFQPREWLVPRPRPDQGQVAAVARRLQEARRPALIVGGGVRYSDAGDAVWRLARRLGAVIGVTQAGMGALADAAAECPEPEWPVSGQHGGVGVTGSAWVNEHVRRADVVVAVGTRLGDFTSASATLIPEGTPVVGVNVRAADAHRAGAVPLIGDARESASALLDALGPQTTTPWWQRPHPAVTSMSQEVLTQPALVRTLNAEMGPRDRLINAAGSLPGVLHALWEPASSEQYQVEYGYSCMGHEIAAGLGFALADPDAWVVVLVGDGSLQMMPSEIATAVAEGARLTICIVDNAGFASIGSLSSSVGQGRFGTEYRLRTPHRGVLDGDEVPTDCGALAASLGATLIRATTLAEVRAALRRARSHPGVCAVHVRVAEHEAPPESGASWHVPTPEAPRRAGPDVGGIRG